MRFDVQVQGLKELQRASGLAPKQFDTAMRHSVRVSAIQMRHVMLDEVGKFAVGGKGGRFAQSIRYRISGLTAVIGSMAPTAWSIETGRRVGEVVPIAVIERWVKTRGIVRAIFNVSSQQIARRINRRAGRFAAIVSTEREEAARIVELIRVRGTSPKLYGHHTIDRSRDRVLKNFKESTQKALRAVAQLAKAA